MGNIVIVADVVIQMDINRRRFTHDRFNCHEVFIHPTEVLFLIPHIAIHFFLKGSQLVDVQLLLRLGDGLRHLGIAADVDLFPDTFSVPSEGSMPNTAD